MINRISKCLSGVIVGTFIVLILFTLYNSFSKAYVEYDEEEALKYYKIDLANQVDNLFNDISNDTQVDKKYLETIFLLAGKTVIYKEEEPNIYFENTMQEYKAPFDLPNVKQKYNKKYVNNKTLNAHKTSKYYLPDATYNVALSLKKIMISRRNASRTYRKEFESFKPNVQDQIIYYETILKYLGWNDKNISNFVSAYLDILSLENKDNIPLVEKNDGVYIINQKYANILLENNINKFDDLAKIMYKDDIFLLYNSYESLSNSSDLPYKFDQQTKINLLNCVCCLVGKVRYVWGGGHLGTCNIKGINPLWEEYNNFYINSGHNDYCIQPAYSWCPIHGKMESTENSCLEIDKGIASLEEFFNEREEIYFNLSKREKKHILEKSPMSDFEFEEDEKISPHRFEGLDCSGFMSWAFHQIDTSKSFDCGAKDFLEANKTSFNEIEYGVKLQPCDLISWNTHICMVVGKFDDYTYLVVEATPNQIMFGVATYFTNDQDLIDEAKIYATKMNKVFGGTNLSKEEVNLHELSVKRGLTLGRYKYFEDSNYVDTLSLNNIMIVIQDNLKKN